MNTEVTKPKHYWKNYYLNLTMFYNQETNRVYNKALHNRNHKLILGSITKKQTEYITKPFTIENTNCPENPWKSSEQGHPRQTEHKQKHKRTDRKLMKWTPNNRTKEKGGKSTKWTPKWQDGDKQEIQHIVDTLVPLPETKHNTYACPYSKK